MYKSKILFLFYLIFFLFFTKDVYSQNSQWIVYDPTNSLLNISPKCLAVDTIGNKWIATSAGLTKFNDNTWEVFIPK